MVTPSSSVRFLAKAVTWSEALHPGTQGIEHSMQQTTPSAGMITQCPMHVQGWGNILNLSVLLFFLAVQGQTGPDYSFTGAERDVAHAVCAGPAAHHVHAGLPHLLPQRIHRLAGASPGSLSFGALSSLIASLPDRIVEFMPDKRVKFMRKLS